MRWTALVHLPWGGKPPPLGWGGIKGEGQLSPLVLPLSGTEGTLVVLRRQSPSFTPCFPRGRAGSPLWLRTKLISPWLNGVPEGGRPSLITCYCLSGNKIIQDHDLVASLCWGDSARATVRSRVRLTFLLSLPPHRGGECSKVIWPIRSSLKRVTNPRRAPSPGYEDGLVAQLEEMLLG